MLIDWSTVIFQIINFLILVILLKRFLYGPIIKAMDEREQKIAQRMADAGRMNKKAEEHAAELAAEKEKFVQNRMALQQQARLEIDKWKEDSIQRLKSEIANQKKEWQKSLDDEQDAFFKKLKISISRQVFQVARKTFADLADDRLEIHLIDTFLEKIQQDLTDIEKQEVKGEELHIISGFPLRREEQDRLHNGLKKFFPDQRVVQFQEEPDVGFGLRLIAGNHKWEWNLDRYMQDIESEILKTMSIAK